MAASGDCGTSLCSACFKQQQISRQNDCSRSDVAVLSICMGGLRVSFTSKTFALASLLSQQSNLFRLRLTTANLTPTVHSY